MYYSHHSCLPDQPSGARGVGGGRVRRPVVAVAGLGGGPVRGVQGPFSAPGGRRKDRSVGGVRVQVP